MALVKKLLDKARGAVSLLALGVLSTGCPTTQDSAVHFPEVGGTVYSFFDGDQSIDQYIQLTSANVSTQQDNWNKDVKSIVEAYNVNPQCVRDELAKMYAAGQRKLGMVMWYVAPDASLGTQFIHTVVPDANGNLTEQQQSNLLNFIADAQSVGFNEIQIRFGAQGAADPNSASTFDPQQVEQSWNLIKATHDLISAKKFQLQLRYDIAPELIGADHIVSHNVDYVQTLLLRYLQTFGDNDVVISWNSADAAGAKKSLELLQSTYTQAGLTRPSILAIDSYDGSDAAMSALAQALQDIGWKGIPIYIQETYDNDSASATSFKNAMQNLGLNIRFVMQWPLQRGSPIVAVSDSHPINYNVYLNP